MRSVLAYLALLLVVAAPAQKYNFVNWTVEDGLIQSQAAAICQDQYRQLWIGTEGGISRFDGKKFNGYTIQDGLIANQINTLFCDKNGELWIGTNLGISVYNGRYFQNLKPPGPGLSHVVQIVQAQNGDIYATDNLGMLRIRNKISRPVLVSGDSTEKITTLYSDTNGSLLCAIYQKGIYSLKDTSWALICPGNTRFPNLHIRSMYITSSGDTLLGTSSGLFRTRNKEIIPYAAPVSIKDITILCIAEDSKHKLWFGTDNGCYKLEDNQASHFDGTSGFTDNAINHIYRDIENNLWFSTNGDGIYKFRENTITYYDKASGLSNTIIMGVTQAQDKTIYTGGYGGGLYKINKNNLEEVLYKGQPVLNDAKVNCLYTDSKNNIWIGTLNNGVYIYNEKNGLAEAEGKHKQDQAFRGATVFLEDQQGNMLIGTNRGLFVKRDDGSVSRARVASNLITALKQFDKDHVLIGTSKGIFLMDQNYEVVPYHEELFGKASVLCLFKNHTTIWIGTTDKGVISWNYKTGSTNHYTTSDGLPSNFIYSIDVSDRHKAWIGTGFGISTLKVDDEGKVLGIKNYGRSDGLLGMECNHNCLLKAADSSLWFGTTKGLFHFDPYTNINEKNQPFMLLRSVKLFSSAIADSSLFKRSGTWFNIPEGLVLGSKQNHLTFELSSIYFTNPEDVIYRYKLEGIDKGYTSTSNPNITYPALPPGKYTLKVSGLTKGGAVSANEINYSFEIEKAFYQTRFFQLMVILLLLGTGALLAYVFTRGKQKRKQKAKELLEKIREEEFMKLRQRTAEDFHDEMGNSLTRISVLTDILRSKINGREQEVTNLVTQIKENTTALYNGSKDIIWSLNSQNDGIFEITEHIKDIGNELFHDTTVDFQYTHNITQNNKQKLKLDYSRNLTMIFKEAYSNILKHSSADAVNITLHLDENGQLDIFIKDNGKGFDPGSAQNGNGLKNMRNRITRMNGTMRTSSSENKGTEIYFQLKNIFI